MSPGSKQLNVMQSERVQFRSFSENDLNFLVQLNGNPEVMKYIRTVESREQCRETLTEMIDFTAKNFPLGYWACFEGATQEFIGCAVLRYLGASDRIEAGYKLVTEKWGQGFATEILSRILEYGFQELKTLEIVALVHHENSSSVGVIRKQKINYQIDIEPFASKHLILFSFRQLEITRENN